MRADARGRARQRDERAANRSRWSRARRNKPRPFGMAAEPPLRPRTSPKRQIRLECSDGRRREGNAGRHVLTGRCAAREVHGRAILGVDAHPTERFELHGDRIVCMNGTKKEHREAVQALDEEIQKRKRTGCHVDIGDAIKATTGTSPYYPDLIMVCGPQEYEDVDGIDVLKNPCVVIEVLSRTTRKPTRASSSKATSDFRVSSWSYCRHRRGNRCHARSRSRRATRAPSHDA